MSRSEKKILVIEDEQKIAEVIKSYLEHSGYSVLIFPEGSRVMETIERYAPNLVILDLMLPGISGEDLCKAIRKKSRIPIIMLTAKVAEDSIIEGFNIGADDYITKPFSPRQLTARVAALLRRSEAEGPLADILSYNDDDLWIDCFKHEVRKKGTVVNLTPNEYRILLTMIKYPLKTFTRDELIVTALGDDFDGLDRTIDSHIKNLRLKIEDDTKVPQYILTVRGTGYRFGGEK